MVYFTSPYSLNFLEDQNAINSFLDLFFTQLPNFLCKKVFEYTRFNKNESSVVLSGHLVLHPKHENLTNRFREEDMEQSIQEWTK